MPVTFGSCLIPSASVLIASANRRGERGHPWHVPLSKAIESDNVLFVYIFDLGHFIYIF